MPCKTLVKNIVLVMLIADSVFGEGGVRSFDSEYADVGDDVASAEQWGGVKGTV